MPAKASWKEKPSINDGCIFKINKLESVLCNDYGHTTNNDGVCTNWSLHLENLSNVEAVSCISSWSQGEIV